VRRAANLHVRRHQMTSAQIVGLGVRLFAIWLVVSLLRHIPAMWRFNLLDVAAADSSTNVVIVVVAALMLVLAVVLWFFPLTVANKIIPRSSKTDHVHVPIEQAESVGFSLLGLWVLTNSVPDSFYWTFMAYQASRPNSILELRASEYSYMLATAVEVVLGIWLLFGAQGLRRLLRWARTAGT
jgi:hypothetical protein